MRLGHRVSTGASPGQVWSLLSEARRWPQLHPALHSVPGASGRVVSGQHLMAALRGIPFALPIDVLDVVPERRLVLRVHALPGLSHDLTTDIVPRLRGGCTVTCRIAVDGVLARPAALPFWLMTGIALRVLGVRAERAAKAAREARLTA